MNGSLFQGEAVTSRRIIYTPSLFATANLLYLQEAGSLSALKPHVSRRSNLSSYLFFVVTKGRGTLTYHGISRNIKSGDCVFLDCREAYSHCSSEDLWALKWVHFYGCSMQGIYEKYVERGGECCFTPENIYSYESLLEEIYTIAASEQYVKDMRIFEKLTSLLTLLMEQSWNPEKMKRVCSKKQSLQDIKEYLDQHYAEKIYLENLSQRFYINKFYLTRVFKETFGITIAQYLLQVRITHAKHLLRFSDLAIGRISQTCGMSDPNYFSRIFKKLEGCTPGEYRRRW